MMTVVIALVVVICVAGGLFYGLSYLRSKANKTSVISELAKKADELIKK